MSHHKGKPIIKRGTTLTNDQRESLIRLVQERKFLWAKNDADRNNRILIDNAWKEIAAQIGTDVNNARRKWRNLQDIFGRSRKIHKKQFAQGTSVSEPRWPFWKQMQFVTCSSQDQDDDDVETLAEQSADGQFDSESMHSESFNVNSSIDLSRVKSEKLDEILYNAIQNGSDSGQFAMTSLGKRKFNSAFGDYVEERLSMLPFSVRLNAEHEICNILKVKLQESEANGLLIA